MPSQNTFTLADVLHQGFELYHQEHGPLPAQEYMVAHAIMRCHSPWLGGHIWRCEECGHEVTLYNSCRNRHCPSCQAHARLEWVEARIGELLPVPYFHLVFTLPEQLRDIALRNRKPVYAIMFRAVSELLRELGANPRRLGGTVGFICVLHTWTQTLEYHPHLHVVVPGGALSADRTHWKPALDSFLFPIPVMRKLYRAKVLDYLDQAVDKGEVRMHGQLAMYEAPSVFAQLLADLHSIDWVVYAKPPFGSPERVIKYLGNYTHRVAISNARIKEIADGLVTFSYLDRRDKEQRRKLMRLSLTEFIRRSMMHLVPEHFVRIRHYGFLGNRLRGELLPLCRKALGVQQPELPLPEPWQAILERLAGTDRTRCPKCTKGRMVIIQEVPRLSAHAA